MHTDRKIGFAMGILLIGIVAALFFRNEPLLRTDVQGVRREEELNQRLKDRNVAVYLDDKPRHKGDDLNGEPAWTLRDVLKSMDSRNKELPSPVSSRQRKVNSELRNEPDLDGFRTWKDAPDEGGSAGTDPATTSPKAAGQESSPATSRPLPALMPDSLVKDTTPSGESPVPSPAAPGDPFPPAPTEPSTSSKEAFVPPAEFEEYVVKYGDTLSGIAEKFLGSQGKYMQIFEANKDRMSSPDRLEVGKPLRIPKVAARPGTTL
jgi:hypothetical protein